jgi:SAM-dependent methyltransferase
VASLLTPPRRHDAEYLDDPRVDPAIVRRSLRDVALANALFGGTRAVLGELASTLAMLGATSATLLDVGTGLGDIPAHARRLAKSRGVALRTFAIDGSEALAQAARCAELICVRGDARALPFADGSVDVVMCSQVLHHFRGDCALSLVRELTRVARHRVIVGELRRSWLAAAGIWAASFPLRFHPVSRHDGVVSVLRGFTAAELRALVHEAVGVTPQVRYRLGFRVTASWGLGRDPK